MGQLWMSHTEATGSTSTSGTAFPATALDAILPADLYFRSRNISGFDGYAFCNLWNH